MQSKFAAQVRKNAAVSGRYAIALTHLSTFMPRLHAASAGRYSASLFATYALVLAIAEVVTLRASA
jgi:hypothetical protein